MRSFNIEVRERIHQIANYHVGMVAIASISGIVLRLPFIWLSTMNCIFKSKYIVSRINNFNHNWLISVINRISIVDQSRYLFISNRYCYRSKTCYLDCVRYSIRRAQSSTSSEHRCSVILLYWRYHQSSWYCEFSGCSMIRMTG